MFNYHIAYMWHNQIFRQDKTQAPIVSTAVIQLSYAEGSLPQTFESVVGSEIKTIKFFFFLKNKSIFIILYIK